MPMNAGKQGRFPFFYIFSLILLLAPLIYGLQLKLEKAVERSVSDEDILYVTPGKYLKPLVLGYDVAVADLIWLRAVQYIGGEAPSGGTYKWLYPMADTVTDLDPTFDMVYYSAGIVLAVYSDPKRIEESVAILKKGTENSHEFWMHPFYLSFMYFHYLGDYKTAAEYMAMAAARPGHPKYTEKLAARLYAQAKDPESGIIFLSQVIETAKDEKVRLELEERLTDLVTERDLNRLEDAVSAYTGKMKKRPSSLNDLVGAKILAELPKEPGGGRYYLAEDGSVRSSRMKERMKVFGVPER